MAGHIKMVLRIGVPRPGCAFSHFEVDVFVIL
jgi:hypothetical protein